MSSLLNAREYLAQLEDQTRESDEVLELNLESIRKWWDYRGIDEKAPVGSIGVPKDMKPSELARLQSTYIRGVFDHLLEKLPKGTAQALSNTAVGVLPTRSVNAYCIRAPAGDPLIIVERGFMKMVHFFAEQMIIAQALIHEHGANEEGAFVLQLASRHVVNFFRKDLRTFPITHEAPHRISAYANLAAYGAELFALAHELAHIHAGHLGDAKTIKRQFSRNCEGIDFYQQSTEREYEADEIAWSWYSNFARDPLLGPLGEDALVLPLWIFQIMALLELNTKEVDKYSTHPPAASRMKRIVDRIPESNHTARAMLEVCEKGLVDFSACKPSELEMLDEVLESLPTEPQLKESE